MWKRYILWAITILWATGIFCFSAQPADDSAEPSHKITQKIVRCFSKENVSASCVAKLVEKVHHFVRKMAHFGLYMVLGVLVFLLCLSYFLQGKSRLLISFGVSVLYAITDEWHQFYVPGRSCQFSDVLLDSAGALVGIIVVSIIFSQIKKNYQKN